MAKTYPIPVSNGLLEHCARMGAAVWYFMWCVDKTTKEQRDEAGNLIGIVYGGKPCHDSNIAANLQVHVNTIRNWRKHLVKEGYIQTTRTPNGYSIKVANSKKWSGKGAEKNALQPPKRITENCESQETVNHNSEPSDSQKPAVESQKPAVESQEPVNAIRHNSDSTETEQRQNREARKVGLLDSVSKPSAFGSEQRISFKPKVLTTTRKKYRECIQKFREEEGITDTDDPSDYPPTSLNTHGIEYLMAALKGKDWTVEEVGDAFHRFMRERYLPAFGTRLQIQAPLAIFAGEVDDYRAVMGSAQ
jgi:hypothetical protein